MMFFEPFPLLSNPHLQTVLGALLQGQARPARHGTRLVPLPDGDKIVLIETMPRAPIGPDRIVLLIHGLGGCHRSPHIERTTHRLSGLGWRVLRMNLHGAGVGIKLARGMYNANCSGDVRSVVEFLAGTFPGVPLAVIGFSLGGSITLKYAGELGSDLPPSLRAVAAIAPPIDLIRCSELIARYPLYDGYYLRHLVKHVEAHQRHFPDLPPVAFPARLTLRQFDEIYTAPRGGFADALDYYRRASSMPWIPRIALPAFVLTARDDPFIAVEPFEEVDAPANVQMHITPHGGHVGFLGHDGAGGIRWAETQLVNWLEKQVATRREC